MKVLKLILIFISIIIFSLGKKNDVEKINQSIEKQLRERLRETLTLIFNFEYKKAIIETTECINIADSLQNDSLLGIAYLTRGILHSNLGKEELAIKNHKFARDIFVRTKNYKYLGRAYNNIASTYIENSNHLDSGFIYFKKALKNYELAENIDRIALVCFNLGEAYQKNNQLKKATYYLKRVIKLGKEYNYPKPLTFAYQNMAKVFAKKNNTSKTLYYLNFAEKLANKNQYETALVLIYKLKSSTLEKIGDLKNSFVYLKKYNKLLDKIHQSEKSKITHEISAKFELKENKTLLEKATLKNNLKANSLKQSKRLVIFISFLFIISLFVALLLLKNYLLKSENNKLLVSKNEELKKLQLQTELNLLKSKIQPNFFFNTLNNLYTLIVKKSDKSKNVVLYLSELMQYTIYGSRKTKTSLWSEINSMQNYISLECIRHDNKAFPTIEIDGKIDDIEVPPLLYITFLENCFKHGNVNDANFNLKISFKNVKNKQLNFIIKNTFNNIDTEQIHKKNIKEDSINNIKRRLKLIYKENYDLKINIKKNIFIVELKIPI